MVDLKAKPYYLSEEDMMATSLSLVLLTLVPFLFGDIYPGLN